MSPKERYLTIHGHFYQPPRENPWLEAIELQDSALPFHDWNERINFECYNPNSVSRIVDHQNRLLDIVNNYSLMSFNIGPTLMSWLEANAPLTYKRIVQADQESVKARGGHGNAIAQVYNHMIMPLANLQDKITQTLWGIKDFQHRFGRMPEGIWLAETAVDDETLEVLVDHGIKFTILSPYQAAKVRPLKSKQKDLYWDDVSWGNVDPARAYRYYIKNNPEKFIDLFFYDGSISKSVAFDNLLKDGEKFIKRIQDGVSDKRDYNQLVNLGTDGESYGHHTKFGDMALSYIQKVKAKEAGFTLTNYGEYLEKEPATYEVDIKQSSSWSCFHGVGRWAEDCGCSTGSQPGWNQKWRKPLRDGLNWLRDELIEIFEEHGKKYFKNPWEARNNYITVILDRNEDTISKFLKKEQSHPLDEEEKVLAIKLLEMQRQAMLMFTSCGWFFSEISGIEPVQILKYAARAIQLAQEYTIKDIEKPFLDILELAKSNIKKQGTGKDIYQKYVKPSIVNIKQVVSHWAISSLYEDFEPETDIYCYKVKKIDYHRSSKGNSNLVIGRIQVSSSVTLESHDMIFAMLRFSSEDFHCTIREFVGNAEYNRIKSKLISEYSNATMTEVIRTFDENLGREYYTLKDLFFEERRKIVNLLLKDKLEKFDSTYKSLFNDSKTSIFQLQELGLKVPSEFNMVAHYTLSHAFNKIITKAKDVLDPEVIRRTTDIHAEAKKLGIKLDNKASIDVFSAKLTRNLDKLAKNLDEHHAQIILDTIQTSKDIGIELDLTEAQNIYFKKIYIKLAGMINKMRTSKDTSNDKQLIAKFIKVGERLNINVDQYYSDINRIIPPVNIVQE